MAALESRQEASSVCGGAVGGCRDGCSGGAGSGAETAPPRREEDEEAEEGTRVEMHPGTGSGTPEWIEDTGRHDLRFSYRDTP